MLAFAFGIGGDGPVSAYTYGWAFMQMPYAVVAVSVMGAVTPELAGTGRTGTAPGSPSGSARGCAARWASSCRRRSASSSSPSRSSTSSCTAAHGHGHLLAGTVLAVLAAGLPGFTCFQFAIRGLQSMQRARDAFWLYALENGLNIALAVAIGRHSIGALTATVSIAYSVAAVVAARGWCGAARAPSARRAATARSAASRSPRRATGVVTRPRLGGDGLENGRGARRAARVVSVAAGAATFVVVSAVAHSSRAARRRLRGSL